MKPIKQILLDENIPHGIRKYFMEKGMTVKTVQYLGWGGYRNGELSELVKNHDMIILTRDRDFTYLWKKYKIQVIFLEIHPPTIDYLLPATRRVFDNWKYDIDNPFLIIVQKDILRFWKE